VTRIVIAAASAVVRAGLEALLSATPGWEVAGSFADASHVDSLRPDVLVAALPLGGLPVASNGAATAAPAAAPAIVLLTSEGQPEWTAEALRTGVRALLPRDAPAAAILAAVEAAANGLAVIDPQELEGLLGAPGPVDAADAGGAPLTPREMEVLRMMADGAANKEIAWKLAISEHTVKFHVASVMGKLNASSRTEAVTRGLRRGLILM
jgi:two-component system, NarL family, response regulator YdfI